MVLVHLLLGDLTSPVSAELLEQQVRLGLLDRREQQAPPEQLDLQGQLARKVYKEQLVQLVP
jgi:hypothetical protein